jgi:hypothetical protein
LHSKREDSGDIVPGGHFELGYERGRVMSAGSGFGGLVVSMLASVTRVDITHAQYTVFSGKRARYLYIESLKFVKNEHARYTVEYFPVDKARVIYTNGLNS